MITPKWGKIDKTFVSPEQTFVSRQGWAVSEQSSTSFSPATLTSLRGLGAASGVDVSVPDGLSPERQAQELVRRLLRQQDTGRTEPFSQALRIAGPGIHDVVLQLTRDGDADARRLLMHWADNDRDPIALRGLVTLARERDEGAWHRLSEMAIRIARQIVSRNRDFDEHDLQQDALLALLRATTGEASTLDQDRWAPGWFATVISRTLSRARKRAGRQRPTDPTALAAEAEAWALDVSSVCQACDAVDTCTPVLMAELNPREYDVVRAIVLDSLSVRETARRLEMATTTIHDIYHRALEKMRARMFSGFGMGDRS